MQDTIQYFNGTIVITDPFYVLNENNSDDWGKCIRGNKMELLGLDNYATMFHVQPDMSWVAVKPTENENAPFKLLGRFHVQTGNATVFLLDELLTYNPSYDIHEQVKQKRATVIENFNGNILIMYKHDIGPEVATIAAKVPDSDEVLFFTSPDQSIYVDD